MGEEQAAPKPDPAATTAVELTGFVMGAEEAERAAAAAGVATVQDLLPLLVPSAMERARPDLAVPRGRCGARRQRPRVRRRQPRVPRPPAVPLRARGAVPRGQRRRRGGTRAVAVSHMPCGHCRQFLQEIRGAAGVQILVTSDAAVEGRAPEWRTVASLLPRPFGPGDLLPEGVALVLEPHGNDLGGPVANGFARGDGDGDLDARLREAAEAAARAAHAPYSKCPSGFAVADGDGRIYAGGCLESAAYNPTLGPVQAAIIGMVAAGGGLAVDVVAAALVEKERAEVAQEATARIFLDAVAPRATFHVYNYRPSDA